MIPKLKTSLCVCVGAALSLLATLALSAEADKPFAAPEAAERVATPSAGSLAQVTFSLLLVLGAIFAAAWLMRRVKTFNRFGAGPIEVLADISLGQKERAVLVQVGGKQLLIGVAPGRVNTLHVLEQPVVGGGQKAIAGPDGSPPRPDFKAIFKRSLGL